MGTGLVLSRILSLYIEYPIFHITVPHVCSRSALKSPGRNISSAAWRTKSWLNASLMTLLEWAFLMFAGKLRETLSSFSCNAFFPQCPQRAHSRPGSVTNTEGIRMSKSECLQPGGSQSVRDRFIPVPVGALALRYSRMDSLSSEHSTFERLSLCGGGGVHPGREHRVSVVLLWPGALLSSLASRSLVFLPRLCFVKMHLMLIAIEHKSVCHGYWYQWDFKLLQSLWGESLWLRVVQTYSHN